MRTRSLWILIVLVSRVLVTGSAAPGGEAAKTDTATAGAAWYCHVIQQKHPRAPGADGATIRDFDGDGRPDVLAPFEHKGYSRIYFHPGVDRLRDGRPWPFVQFKGDHDDAGAGDLDMDGNQDVIIGNGTVLFNPGGPAARQAAKWTIVAWKGARGRCPIVVDLDGDGHSDLLQNGCVLHKAPADRSRKRDPAAYSRHRLGRVSWPMNVFVYDMDKDGDLDLVTNMKAAGVVVWLEHPNDGSLDAWKSHVLLQGSGTDKNAGRSEFFKIADVNGDGRDDLVLAWQFGKSKGNGGSWVGGFWVLLRQNDRGRPKFKRVAVRFKDTPARGLGYSRGINVGDYNMDGKMEVLGFAMHAPPWLARYAKDPADPNDWAQHTQVLRVEGAAFSKKPDDVINCDVDGDGDVDIVTTDESGVGILWLENPRRRVGGGRRRRGADPR